MDANLTTFVFDQHFVKSHLIIIIIIYIQNSNYQIHGSCQKKENDQVYVKSSGSLEIIVQGIIYRKFQCNSFIIE